MSRYVQCPDCWGAGWLTADGEPCESTVRSGAHTCENCDGRGELLEADAPSRPTPRTETGD